MSSEVTLKKNTYVIPTCNPNVHEAETGDLQDRIARIGKLWIHLESLLL